MGKLTLKQLRLQRELTREELSAMTGISARSIQNYEDDVLKLRKASLNNVELLANALEVSIDDIFLIPTSK